MPLLKVVKPYKIPFKITTIQRDFESRVLQRFRDNAVESWYSKNRETIDSQLI
jgi:hypothetical protein